jgi:predicted DNA-binding transcriptional regulator AlpA
VKILLDIDETAHSVSLSVSTVRKMMREKTFPSPVRVGIRILWRVADIEKWADSLTPDGVQDYVAKKRGRPRLVA